MTLETVATARADVLVLGAGGAGLRAAIAAAEAGARVAVVTDARTGVGSLTAVSGGAFASTRPSDYVDRARGWEAHFDDTVVGSRYLCDQDLALELTRRIPQQVPLLARYGVSYDIDGDPPWLAYCIDPGHHAAKMYYGPGALGTDLTSPMAKHASNLGVSFFEGMVATKLVLDGSRVIGALALTRDGHVQSFAAGATVLATGGAGHLFERTDNSPGATGDGYVLAYEAGLSLRDMEFMQFYPTTLNTGTPGVYYEILVAGINAPLLNSTGDDLRALHGLDDPHSLTRDVLSIAIMREVAGGRGVSGGVLLDLGDIPAETLDAIRSVLPTAAHKGQRRFVVAPSAHTYLGGVCITPSTETALQGLFAAGEVCGGVHGANRLGGNALSEVLTFGAMAGGGAARFAATHPPAHTDEEAAARECRRLGAMVGADADVLPHLRAELKNLMWRHAGVLRDEASLTEALGRIAGLKQRVHRYRAAPGRNLQRLIRTSNLLTTAELLCLAARARTESRGSHCRTDFTAEDNQGWLRTIIVSRGPEGPVLSCEPVTLSYRKPSAG
jgi:fumarate reductase (CoM/CoB) subunit A